MLASVSLVVTGNWHAGLFLAAFVLMTIIPGHILNYRYRHSRSDVRQAVGPRPGRATKDGAAEEDGSTEEDGAATENDTAEGGAATDSAPADRPLDAAENIALVGRMIDNTRSRMVRNAGRPFLIWGYATVVTTLAVWAAYALFPGRNWYYLWLLLPVFGTALSLLTMPKADGGRVYTFIDRVIGQVWLVMGLTAWFVSLLSVFGDMPVPILRHPADDGHGNSHHGARHPLRPGRRRRGRGDHPRPRIARRNRLLVPALFIAGFVAMMIVPGHILNYKSNHRNNSRMEERKCPRKRRWS
ncbi:MAG: hypothetical protein ACLRMJ_11255 [Alistipes finegoldii]